MFSIAFTHGHARTLREDQQISREKYRSHFYHGLLGFVPVALRPSLTAGLLLVEKVLTNSFFVGRWGRGIARHFLSKAPEKGECVSDCKADVLA